MTVDVRNLTVEYITGGYRIRPIDDLSFHAAPGELVLLHGASGCGKTTLLSVLGGLLRPTSGRVRVGDVDVTTQPDGDLVMYRRARVGMIFQAFNLVDSLTALENVEVPLRLSGRPARAARAEAARLLGLVDLDDRADHRPGALSGGQRQRVAIARALANDPPLLLADEPTAHLDYIQVEGVVRLLRRLADDGRTVIVATHDHRLLPVADRVIELTPEPAAPSGDVVRRLKPGAKLFRQGDASDLIYLIMAGTVDVLRETADGGQRRLATVTQGQYVGELGPLLGLQRSATAKAGAKGATLRCLTTHAFRQAAVGGLNAVNPRPLRAPTRVGAAS
jgi:putative ABC transport system ATP-binding protein